MFSSLPYQTQQSFFSPYGGTAYGAGNTAMFGNDPYQSMWNTNSYGSYGDTMMPYDTGYGFDSGYGYDTGYGYDSSFDSGYGYGNDYGSNYQTSYNQGSSYGGGGKSSSSLMNMIMKLLMSLLGFGGGSSYGSSGNCGYNNPGHNYNNPTYGGDDYGNYNGGGDNYGNHGNYGGGDCEPEYEPPQNECEYEPPQNECDYRPRRPRWRDRDHDYKPPVWKSPGHGGTWGDPHFRDLTESDTNLYKNNFDVKGEVGKVYSIISDQRVQLNSKFAAGDPTIGTINGEFGIKLKDDTGKEHRIHFNVLTGVVTNDGVEMKPGEKLEFKMGGKDASVTVQTNPGNAAQTQVLVRTDEYEMDLNETLDQNHDYQVIRLTDGGVLGDWVNPHGILGQTADGDSNIRQNTDPNDVNGQGEIDFDPTEYEIADGDLFGETGNDIINRYGKTTRKITRNGEVVRLDDQDGNILATRDKDGNLVSVRRFYDAEGNFHMTLADGTTEIDQNGDIIEPEAPEGGEG